MLLKYVAVRISSCSLIKICMHEFNIVKFKAIDRKSPLGIKIFIISRTIKPSNLSLSMVLYIAQDITSSTLLMIAAQTGK